MRKGLVILVISFLLLVGCSNNKNNEGNRLEIDGSEAKIGEIQNLKESDKEIPRFTIVVKGMMTIWSAALYTTFVQVTATPSRCLLRLIWVVSLPISAIRSSSPARS